MIHFGWLDIVAIFAMTVGFFVAADVMTKAAMRATRHTKWIRRMAAGACWIFAVWYLILFAVSIGVFPTSFVLYVADFSRVPDAAALVTFIAWGRGVTS